MVMKTFFKSIRRMIFAQITRLLTITFIIFVSVSLMYGISEVRNKIDTAVDTVCTKCSIPDIVVKSTSNYGITDRGALEEAFGQENLKSATVYEMTTDNKKIVRFMGYEFDSGLFDLKLISGSLPSNPGEVVLQSLSTKGTKYSVGQVITLNGAAGEVKFTISGIVENKYFFARNREPSYTDGETLDAVIYCDMPVALTTDIFVTLSRDCKIFSHDYKVLIENAKAKLAGQSDIRVLTLYENFGLFSVHSYAAKVEKIAIIFMVFFMLVTLLVIFSTITRLLDEERPQIACLKTLGYSNFACHMKYFIFVIFAVVLGSLLAAPVGGIITKLIFTAFDIQYLMPAYPNDFAIGYYSLSVGIILLSSLISTFFSATKMTSLLPAKLLVPKTPKKGKKVLLEKIPFIWNRLSFKYKSTLRNVFLFKSRFFMTVISIIGSTILVLAGLGLLDNAKSLPSADSIVFIALVLIVFAALLCALVIYNLTNINISERSREISSLMVLGYFDSEVTSYIFREIYIMSFIGAVLGIPLGALFLDFVFNFISFGAVSVVNWWSWLLAPVLTMLFTVLSTLLLYKKIVKTDISVSLKTLD